MTPSEVLAKISEIGASEYNLAIQYPGHNLEAIRLITDFRFICAQLRLSLQAEALLLKALEKAESYPFKKKTLQCFYLDIDEARAEHAKLREPSGEPSGGKP